MALFTCPGCGRQISVDRAGQSVLCGSCGQSVYIAAPADESKSGPPSLPTPVESVAPVTVIARSKRKKKGSWLNIAVHFTISAIAMFVAYKLITQKRPAPSPHASHVPVRASPRPHVRLERSSPVQQVKVKPVDPAPAPISVSPLPVASPLNNFPAFVDLPPASDDAIVGLTGRPAGATIELLTNSDTLKLEGEKLVDRGKTVAGLRISDALLEFRWMKNAPPASIAAVRNSVLKLTASGAVHHLALRSPVKAKAPIMELSQSKFRICAKCDSAPHHSHVRFTFDLAAQLPVKEIRGGTEAMKDGDEALLLYDTTGDAATKVTIVPSGLALCADFATQYQLPSGDVEPLTISRGNRKLKQLERLRAQAMDAQQSIGDLRSYFSNLQSSLRRAQSTGGARAGYAPLVHAQTAVAAGNINREMVATNNRIIHAEQLIGEMPGIEADLQEIQVIAELAHSIKGTRVPYRFFTLVGGQEVDLIVAE